MIERRLALRGPIHLGQTLGPLRHGLGDRTIRLGRGEAWLAMRHPAGAVTLQLQAVGSASIHARAWGDDAEEAL